MGERVWERGSPMPHHETLDWYSGPPFADMNDAHVVEHHPIAEETELIVVDYITSLKVF